ncbi:MAG TPA: Uma2 family endonuclease [Bacteroidetes bacterium]|nr:Uma2 family endonuclease [Bacteroidota bacterium]
MPVKTKNITYKEPPKTITSVNELDAVYGKYSYADYLSWKIKERLELIKGKLFKMSPAPSLLHQEVSGNLFLKIGKFLEGNNCKIFSAPFDVRFPDDSKEDKDVFNTVQPDITVVCDLSKLDRRGCLGAPDLIVEILSPSSSKHDLKYKYELYEEYGVKEYWVVHPEEQTLLIYTLDEQGKYQPGYLKTRGDIVKSTVLVGFELNLDDVFEEPDDSVPYIENRIW